ncbi:MAG TPA: hypothetical protein VK530_18770 [Candidatus Acidoferrum sp.]|nr:hypothetical protein [Candidatus Acidoferrum sp.]
MKTLFLIFSSTFALSALTWFFIWAIWIHAPQGWYGRAFGPVGAPDSLRRPEYPQTRRLAWYRGLKFATIVLLFIATGLLILWHFSVP